MTRTYCDVCGKEIFGEVCPTTLQFTLRFGGERGMEKVNLIGVLALSHALQPEPPCHWCLDCLIASLSRAVLGGLKKEKQDSPCVTASNGSSGKEVNRTGSPYQS